ncbi:MAG: hypothetical protein KJ670_16850 [Alphaproteobacteria bacterium]|jgi:hypothetical protein|nr:hypothetical protein [Rhizobiaceae bacterium]MBU3963782.1 hypothetical protein [Alphaproteobacteria bacterium]MBU4049853.1 hypothetical protein [Alphaproteobacteria bacterium]MBU4090381.1 hypothetical protein [Alphaproteobacteria bacterium]MBU4155160.1 hypothetical protein [Alphaproteobacteria bacterium]
MKTFIAITAVVASLAGASTAFALEPTNGSAAPVQSSNSNIDRTVVGSITPMGAQADRSQVDGSNLNAVYGFNSGRGVTVGTPSHAE